MLSLFLGTKEVVASLAHNPFIFQSIFYRLKDLVKKAKDKKWEVGKRGNPLHIEENNTVTLLFKILCF